MNTQSELVTLSRQGHVEAIARLLNQALQGEGIAVVKASIKGDCLGVLLEADSVPDPDLAVALSHQALLYLQVQSIRSLKVYGRQRGIQKPAWSEERSLVSDSPIHSIATAQASALDSLPPAELKQHARQGDLAAIALLLNRTLDHKHITVEVKLNNQCLQVVLDADQPFDLNAATVLIDRELAALNSPLITTLSIQPRPPALLDSNENLEASRHSNGAAPEDTDFQGNEFELGTRSQLHPISESMAHSTRQVLRPRSIRSDGRNALLIGLALALFLFLSPLNLIFQGFLVLVHELGHALTHWLFGRPAIPSVNLLYGGGVTLVLGQSRLVLGIIYLAIAALIYLLRLYPAVQGIMVLLTVIYSLCLFTDTNMMLSTFMGHGMEVVAIALCLYLATSGRFCRFAGDRAIYAMLGLFTLFSDLQFSWRLNHNPEFRAWYEGGIGGVMDNDFVILAYSYFQTDLSTIATFFFYCCIAAPVVAFLLFRYEPWWHQGIRKLVAIRN